MPFSGDTYDPTRDAPRLKSQLAAVRRVMLTGEWMTLAQIAEKTGYPEASVSARLRDLRKEKFGGYEVEKQYVSRGLWRYRVGGGQREMEW